MITSTVFVNLCLFYSVVHILFGLHVGLRLVRLTLNHVISRGRSARKTMVDAQHMEFFLWLLILEV